MEIFNHNSNVNFLGLRKISIVLAVLLMLGSVFVIATRGLNYGMDFTGGVLVEVSYSKPVQIANARAALTSGGFKEAVVQSLGNSTDLSIRLQPKADPDAVKAGGKMDAAKVAKDVLAALKAKRSDVKLNRAPDFVGPQVGAELRTSGIYAVIFVIIGIMGYLWIRFERRFAIAAVVTEVHDALVTVGIIALTGRQFDLTVLASVLAVVGYSINDKVVVFDRVRELFRLARKAEPEEVLNRSINNTLSRTIITSLFTAITMAALYFFGGPAVHGFAITMLIGILIGTLSSIFIASPILLWLGVSKKDLMPVTKDNPELARRP
ncbi:MULTISPECIES: protein translocase subunit SecF [Oleiagrimonas]|jgi:preprotein translocase subunit SecF|uniref:Protein-export membrane protein SecF n=1 Tax=Oleiagrimonas citrea TaxID=1665687 RepID=A0A846ZKC1_9GAMM|nr:MULTISPECIES: protein translocase subunit SecF [Oleiagrimonas]NKZ38023.1 protein translocase subunit SecF [Oleiagrimonas citrea]RAP57508.1 protein-export membrane protein SecF [Oleiagrimonas sp. MCCC 1A03011]